MASKTRFAYFLHEAINSFLSSHLNIASLCAAPCMWWSEKSKREREGQRDADYKYRHDKK